MHVIRSSLNEVICSFTGKNMSELTARIVRAFSAKVYPNPEDANIKALREEGEMEFRANYLGGMYPWILCGDSIAPVVCTAHDCFTTHDPADKSIVGFFPKFDSALMDLGHYLPKIREAGMRFFRETTWQDRMMLLVTISEVAEERFWLLCAAKAHEQGQQIGEQIGETDEEVDFPLVNAWYLERLHSNYMSLIASPPSVGNYNGKRHIPHGVFLNICPFNFPGAIPMDMATKALAMGNAIIEKSSPKSALSGYLVFETLKIAFERMGIEWRGVINYAPGGAEVVEAMLRSPYISGASFTGSSRVLRDIKRAHSEISRYGFAGTKAPLVFGSAETSGVNPFVVCEDADPVHAALEYVKAVVGRMGQKCSSARLAFVPDNLYDAFVATMTKRLDELRYGDVKTGADIGALASEADVENLHKQINFATCEGGLSTVLYEKANCHGIGYDFPPTILEARLEALICPGRSHEIMNMEFFGPVSTIIRYGKLTDVEKLLSMSEFALTGSIFTNDDATLARLIDVFPAGNLYINRKCTGALVETECFGGLRSASSPSGIKGIMTLALFSSQQTISGFYGNGTDEGERFGTLDMLKSKGSVLSKS